MTSNINSIDGNLVQQLINSSLAVIYKFDAVEGFPLVSISKNVKSVFGFDSNEFNRDKKLWKSRIHPDDIGVIESGFNGIGYHQSISQLEYRFKHKDGHYIWLHDEIQLVEDEVSGCKHIIGISIEIRGKQEKANQSHFWDEQIELQGITELKKSEERYRSLVNVSNEAIFEIATDWSILDCNETACRIFGYSYDELTRMKVLDLMPENIARKVPEEYTEDLTTSNKPGETLKKRRDGTIFPVEFTTKMVEVDGQKKVIAYIRDITKAKRDDLLHNGQIEILDLIAKKSPLESILESIARLIETLSEGSKCSVLLLNFSKDRFKVGAAPGLPEAYWQIMNDTPILETVTCGRAILEKKSVLTEDITKILEWAEYVPNAEDLGIRSAWATPIYSSKKEVLGVFSIYYSEPYEQSILETELIKIATYLAGIAIEQKQEQEKLQESYENLANAQQMTKMGSWEIDLTSKEVYWSDEIYKILGIEKDKVKPSKKFFLSFIHPDDRRHIENDIEVLIKDGKKLDAVHKIIRANEEAVFVHSIGVVKYNENGVPFKLSGTMQDITEQEDTKNQLQLLTTAVESADNGIVITDKNGTIAWVNKAFTKLTGYTSSEALGKNPRVLKSNKHDTEFYENLWSTILSGKVWNGQLVNRRKDRSLYFEEQTITPVRDDYGEITHFIAIKRDITEKKKYHLRLEESLEEKDTLLAEMHHRVKNNLAMISGLLYLQLSNTSNDEVKKLLSISQARIHSIALIHELLYQSEALATIHFEVFLNKLVGYLKNIYQDPDSQIKVNVNTNEIILNVNQAIPAALLINEMVINSYEHAFEGKVNGIINITAELNGDDNMVHVIIGDDGVGLPRNYRYTDPTTLGLKLINTFARQLDADLNISNTPGAGLSFEFKFPADSDENRVRIF